MGNDELSPIDADLWFGRLAMIARGELRSLERSLRHAFHLVQLAPEEFRRSVRPAADEPSFEALLDACQFHEAASLLIHYPSPPVMAFTGTQVIEAEIACPECSALFRGAGANSGSAILGCCLDYLSRLPSPGWCDRETHPCLREGRYERPLPLNLH
jgi:hypothetical protein